MNGSSCSEVSQPQRTFFLKLGGLISVAGFVSILTLLACAEIGCQTETTGQSLSGQAEVPRHVILASGDVVKLTFSSAPELNQSQKIRTDGKLSLPLVGEVDAGGKTVGQLQAELIELYKSQLKTPDVTVSLESSITTVTVSGAVHKPGKLAFERPTTVLQAIMEAGGPSEFGTLKRVRLMRVVNGVYKSQVMDLHDLSKEVKPFYVRDNDMIYVAQSTF
ncbi:MAG TPA: polysaccharide biosynthesis/export family protein [Pyrinomonadaceae bacterium]|jgi:polysaccharide biosynthesis/export protein